MNGKVVVWDESTGWTVVVQNGSGDTLERSYVSMRNHASPHGFAQRFAAHYGRPDPLPIEYAGKSKDYDREMRAIANDPHFMS